MESKFCKLIGCIYIHPGEGIVNGETGVLLLISHGDFVGYCVMLWLLLPLVKMLVMYNVIGTKNGVSSV
jgi:hypothetical protein